MKKEMNIVHLKQELANPLIKQVNSFKKVKNIKIKRRKWQMRRVKLSKITNNALSSQN